MSLLSCIQSFLETYPGMELRPLGEIMTDLSGASVSSYALAPAGGRVTKDVTGARDYINTYVFYALEAAADEADRADNYDFLDSFGAWLEAQEDAGNYPNLPNGYTARHIEAQAALLADIYQNGSALYQVQIEITLTKEGGKYA